MVRLLRRLTSNCALLLLPLTVSGEVIHEPLWVENISPLAQLVALPSQRSADIKQGLSVSLHTDIATHFVSQASERERVFFDGRHKSTALIFDGVCRPSGNLARISRPSSMTVALSMPT